ncbi:uncharacterized protein LOC126278770 [Schistocerca gregaria]|uniref:uncharacterized protein LOC126278770 n=1 Tax=Schistocerca gregaria TaxID=7010 RepID=UPI00211E2328|nr:uncharacterized protein LOC126278770 [Schistocerca gregaria]
MLRSPSHESVTTDLSLFSVSSLASEAGTGRRLVTFKSYSEAQLAAAAGGVAGAGGAPGGSAARGPSPNPDTRHSRPADIPEILWFEEETELIRSCGALSSALGLQKSFSTSDISQLPSPQGTAAARCAVSELALWGDATHARLEPASRSCSTWVAVGDVASTSQLPSPHGAPPPPVPAFTAADLIRSVNKKRTPGRLRAGAGRGASGGGGVGVWERVAPDVGRAASADSERREAGVAEAGALAGGRYGAEQVEGIVQNPAELRFCSAGRGGAVLQGGDAKWGARDV